MGGSFNKFHRLKFKIKNIDESTAREHKSVCNIAEELIIKQQCSTVQCSVSTSEGGDSLSIASESSSVQLQ